MKTPATSSAQMGDDTAATGSPAAKNTNAAKSTNAFPFELGDQTQQSLESAELAEARELVRRFYESFARLDVEAMLDCLHPEITFADPLFPNLRKDQVFEMWRMLMASAARHPEDFKLSYEFVFVEERKAQVHWQAHYRYGGRRKVHNKVLATLTFWDGKIVRHVDGFSFYNWSRQALGPLGLLLGWSSKFRSSVQAAAKKQLGIYMSRPKVPPSSD